MSQEFKLENRLTFSLELPIYRKSGQIYIKIDRSSIQTTIGLDFGPNSKCHIEQRKHLFDSSPGFYNGTGDYEYSNETEWMGIIQEVAELLERAK